VQTRARVWLFSKLKINWQSGEISPEAAIGARVMHMSGEGFEAERVPGFAP